MSLPFKRVRTTYDFLDTMPFGSYVGKTISYVIEFDPNYLKWCTKQDNLIYLSDKCLDALEDRVKISEYDKAFQAAKKSKLLQEETVDWFNDWDHDIQF